MLACFTTDSTKTMVPVVLVSQADYVNWYQQQSTSVQAWLTQLQFRAEPGQTITIPGDQGHIASILCVMSQENDWCTGGLPLSLPSMTYSLTLPFVQDEQEKTRLLKHYAIIWGLGAYQFTRYKKPKNTPALLYVPEVLMSEIANVVTAIYLVRDCINTPADDMGPSELAEVMHSLANQFGAQFEQTIGEALLAKHYNAIYTVGRASDDAPRLLDMRWGNPDHPRVTLVGKGVCFDSGGLDLKGSSYMLLMKKDMGGAAQVLGLARMMMSAQLPICLRVLVPAVENVVSGNAYRPGDIITSHQGLTIEVGNTDAEGRLILADALSEAVKDHPDLVIDIATLTGAARVALGTDLPAIFSNHDEVVNAILAKGIEQQDYLWRMPLFAPYREYLNSYIADINNNSSEPYAGAITAALFLKEFVPAEIPWLHIDLMAWNTRNRPGRPQGGEAMTIRALFAYLKSRYQSN